MSDAHDRLDDRHRAPEELELLRLVGRAPDVRVGRVRLLDRRSIRKAALEEPLAHLPAPAELGDELRVEPRLVDAEGRIREQAVAEEPLDVVALVGRAVAPDVDAVLAHRVDQHRAGDRAPERGRVEVRLAAARDVEGAALQGDEALVDELRPAVDDLGRFGAVVEGAPRDVLDVVLVDLPEIGGEGVRESRPSRGSRRRRRTCPGRPRRRSRCARRPAATGGPGSSAKRTRGRKPGRPAEAGHRAPGNPGDRLKPVTARPCSQLPRAPRR